MSEENKPGTEEPNPQVEVETDPTILYVPLQDRSDHPRSGMTFVLNQGNTTVGRHPESDIFLNDVTVSRHHCRFSLSENALSVEDSGSTNGTYVNHTRVDQSPLEAGDEVLVGRFHFVVAHGDA
jgi:pSer/pThr/pTyr-binding forkhead associated (FHA) protein